jgi:hypothetical protein
MGFNVAALGNYTKEEMDTLKYALVFEGKTAGLLASQVGIKSSEQLNKIATEGFWQQQACGFTASGDTVFTQRALTVGKIGIYLEWCPKELEAKWTQKGLKPGSPMGLDEFEKYIVDDTMQNFAKRKEIAIWQGDTSLNVANFPYLSRFDGLLKLIDADTSVVAATPSTLNTTNIRTILQDIITKIPLDVKGRDNVKVMCGYDTFEMYQNKLATDNLYHYFGDATGYEMKIENSMYTLVGVPGLNGTNRIITGEFGENGNFVLGTDLLNEEEQFELFYAREARQVRFVAETKIGVQYYFGNRIVQYKNS